MRPESGTGVPPRVFATLWLTLCLGMVGFGIVLPVLPFYAERLGASAAEITLLAATFSLAQFFAAPLLGRLGDRVGRRRVLLLSVAGACAAMLAMSAAQSLWALFAARLLAGACGATVSSAQAFVAEHAAPGERARSLGILGSAIGVGFVLGPVIGGLLAAPGQPNLPFLVAAGLSAINFVLAYLWLHERPRERPPARGGPKWAAVRGAIGPLPLISLGFYAAFSAMESTFALLLAARFAWGAHETGWMLALVGVVIVVAQGGLVGRVVRRLGEPTTLRLGLVTLASGLLGIGFAGTGAGMALAAATVAIGNGLISPSLNAMISRRAGPDRQGLHLGVAASAASLGRVLGPVAAGVAFESLGPGWPARLGAALVLLLVLAVRSGRKPG